MSLEQLAQQFLVDDDLPPESLTRLIQKLLPYCVVSKKNGAVEIGDSKLSGKPLVKLVISARLVASKLPDSSIPADITAEDIAKYTGLPKNQVTARGKEAVDEKFADRTGRGSYRARQHKIEAFLDSLSGISNGER